MTCAELARRVGIHFTTASKLKNGWRMPSVATLAAIIIEFDVSDDQVDDLFSKILSADGDYETEAQLFGQWLRETIFLESEAA